MGLKVAAAAPFKQRGTDVIAESEFVVALSLDRDWFSPDQAKRLVDIAVGQGLLSRENDDLHAQFERASVTIPDEFAPDESILQQQSAFEMALDAAVAAGTEKHAAVAGINDRQSKLGVSVEAAAVVYARHRGLNVAEIAARAREGLDAPPLDGYEAASTASAGDSDAIDDGEDGASEATDSDAPRQSEATNDGATGEGEANKEGATRESEAEAPPPPPEGGGQPAVEHDGLE